MTELTIPGRHNYIAVFLTLACDLRCPFCINRFGDAAQLKVSIREFWVQKVHSSAERAAGTNFSSEIIVRGPIVLFADSRTIITEVKKNPDSYKTLFLLRTDTFKGALKLGIETLIEDIARDALE